jgi:hypothetical protein
MVANYPFIVIAESFDGGTRIIEEWTRQEV